MTKSLQEKFISSLRIPHGGIRARVLTGIAADMSQKERKLTIEAIRAMFAERLAKLIGLDAPEIILTKVRKDVENPPGIVILQRKLTARSK